MVIDLGSPAERASRLIAGAPQLTALGLGRRADSLARAAERLLAIATTTPDALGRLAESSGLDEAMVRWGLQTTLETVQVPVLTALGEAALDPGGPRARPVPARLCTVILSANVLTAPVRALFLPLLVGVPVLAKASAREHVLPELLAQALSETDAALGASLDVIAVESSSPIVDALLDRADVVSVYGSDATVQAVRARAPAATPVIAHGHGLGLIYVDSLPEQDPAFDALARAIGEDIAAYDQRGCLSPHAVFVRGGTKTAHRLTTGIYAALAELARERPRGPLPVAAGGAQVQWRGVAAARGQLFEGDGFAVADEGTQPLRASPGYRNIAVHRVDGVEGFAASAAPFGMHLKAIGFFGDEGARELLVQALPSPLAPDISPVGAMQRPPFDAPADGLPPLAGLLRYTGLRARPPERGADSPIVTGRATRQ